MAIRVVSGGLKDWIEELQSKGKLAFSLLQAHEAFPGLSEDAVKLSLNRLSKKDKIVSIYKGLQNKLLDHKAYIGIHGEDIPEIRNWKWNPTISVK